MSHQRPKRISVPNVFGQQTSLNSGHDSLIPLNCKNKIYKENIHLLLGVGYTLSSNVPDSSFAPDLLLKDSVKVFFLENPELDAYLCQEYPEYTNCIPKHWQKISLAHFDEMIRNKDFPIICWWFKQNLMLDSEFWLPIKSKLLAKIVLQDTEQQAQIYANKKILIGCDDGQLLHAEISEAFNTLGFDSIIAPRLGKDAKQNLENPVKICDNTELFFSINLRGLDADGYLFALLQGLQIPVALWFVDNPWHQLTSLRLPWWKKAYIFVTDAYFIEGLQREGAENVYHLPLASAQHMWKKERNTVTNVAQGGKQHEVPNIEDSDKRNNALRITQNAQCIFVGRASFPEKKQFFAAAKLDDRDVKEAFALLRQCQEKPDFHWWTEKFKSYAQNLKLWPKNDVRSIGYGAELCAQAQRVQWLKAMTTIPCAVFGDAVAWQSLLPEVAPDIFHEALDYYGSLPLIYEAAQSVLNVTSLLLPHGLTQRHFDVWAAGGFLWSNKTEGLNIFPKELTAPIAFDAPKDFLYALKNMNINQRHELMLAWQECLYHAHQYTHRMRFVLEKIF